MTQQNNNFAEEYRCLIPEAKKQIEQQQYSAAISNLDYIIENNKRDGYAFFLRGKAYSQLKEYQPALTDYETALNIYRETEDKKYQIYTLVELAMIYPFNGRVRDGFLAQQQSFKLAKEVEISEEDPLYSYISHAAQMSDEGLGKMETSLQTETSTLIWSEFGLMGRMMGYATRGKLQSYLFISVWLIMFIPSLILAIIFSPIWLTIMLYQTWRSKRNSE